MSGDLPQARRGRRKGAGDQGAPPVLLALLAIPVLLVVALAWYLRQAQPVADGGRDTAPPERQVAAPPAEGAVQGAMGVDVGQLPSGRSRSKPPAPFVDLADVKGPLPSPPADPTANMVLIPAGAFLFGEAKEEIDLPAFYIDRYEVSQGEYAEFLRYVRETGDHSHCHPKELPGKDHTPLDWGRPDLTDPRYPVVGLDYWDVWAYAGWVGKRLPSEQEWEKAARGTDGREYPWGDSWDDRLCNWGPSPGNPRTLLPVDSMPEGQSPFGLFHMLGNAAEWTASFMDESRGLHCGRGYCWRIGHMVPYHITYRMAGATNLRDEGSGLRCALDAPGGEKREEQSTNNAETAAPR